MNKEQLLKWKGVFRAAVAKAQIYESACVRRTARMAVKSEVEAW